MLCKFSLLDGRIFMNAFEEPPHVLWVDARGDTVPKIRDPSALSSSETLAHSLHRRFDGIPSRIQHDGVHVPLKSHLVPNKRSCLFGIDAPVKSQCVVSSVLGKEFKGFVGAFCKQGHRNNGKIEIVQTLFYVARDEL